MSSRDKRLAAQAEPMRVLENLMRENAYGHSLHEVFRDFCEMSAIAISNAFDVARREKREARYMNIVGRYKPEELQRFAQMLAALVKALDGEFHDAMGRLFMALELGNHWAGQFFTPYAVALAMAKMQLADADDLAGGKGFITVSDPACGAGCTLIAVAHALKDAGLNYQQVMHVTAQDLDATAVHMCYLQLSLLHVPAVVIVGDTLRLEEHDRWYTPAHFVGRWDWKLRREVRPAAEQQQLIPIAVTERAPARGGQLEMFGGAP